MGVRLAVFMAPRDPRAISDLATRFNPLHKRLCGVFGPFLTGNYGPDRGAGTLYFTGLSALNYLINIIITIRPSP